jgi:hypothetical protein
MPRGDCIAVRASCATVKELSKLLPCADSTATSIGLRGCCSRPHKSSKSISLSEQTPEILWGLVLVAFVRWSSGL